MKIILNPVETMSTGSLFRDYVSNYDKVREFYPANFREDASWEKMMTGIINNNRDHTKLAEILKRQNSILGANSSVMDRINLLTRGSAFAIVTGQQVGILTGPLYTVYKALTAIKLAQTLNDKYIADFIPVFWMESNDHDLAEANHINLLDSKSDLAKLEYMPENYKQDSSMKDVLIDGGFKRLIDDLMSRFPDTEFKDDVFNLIESSYMKPGVNLGSGFGVMMAKLLGKFGLVFLDPSDPDMKRLMSPIFEKNIKNPLKIIEIVNFAGEKLKSKGYDSQIEKSPDSTGLFIEEDGVRRKLFFRDGYFVMDGKNSSLRGDDLMRILEASPEKFSPNVALRPIAQDYILPTIAYVAGPGEISYFSQLSKLYQFFGVNMPIIYPRASLTLLESKVERVLDKNRLKLEDLSGNYEKLFSQLSKNIAEEKLGKLLESSKSGFNEIFKNLAVGLNDFDPNLKNIVESAKKKIDYQISILEERAYKIQRDRDDILRDQIKRACMNIYPDGKPQERVFNIVQYLVLYGLGFVEELMTFIGKER